MAHAYTPGLRVTPHTSLRRDRRLPMKGDVLVGVGDAVRRDQIVARTELPGTVSTINLVNRLGITPEELPRYMLKAQGDAVVAGEPLAETRPLIKWFKTIVSAETSGTVESISTVTGQIMLREPPLPVEVPAYVGGTVVEVLPNEGVVIETTGAFIQGIFGVGGECWGTLHLVPGSLGDPLDPSRITPDCSGKLIVASGLVSHAAIERAREVGAIGVIGAGIRDQDLRELLGFDLGVAITGSEDIGLTVILTEGFGEIAMARRTHEILQACDGREASISGATQIRAGVLRPEIIVPADSSGPTRASEPGSAHSEGMTQGDLLRVIRAPYFGHIGKVAELTAELREVESGARVRVLEVEFDDGSRAIVPRANVELIEE